MTTVAEKLNADDLQEYRAYLQRGETRLSTLHRVAGAFLGGAGLLTLLPVLFRDTFSSLFSELLFLPYPGLPAPNSLQRWFVALPVALSLVLPLWALYLLMKDLVRFYFTGHHFGTKRGIVTYPRFILSGIRVSDDSLDDELPIQQARRGKVPTELLVPASAAARQRLLREAHLVGELPGIDASTDEVVLQGKLREFLFKYTASTVRSLPEEAAKMETSLARHDSSLRSLVLRYAKAFLLTILTTVVTITALVVLDFATPDRREVLGGTKSAVIIPGYLLWLGVVGVYAAWCPIAGFIVRRPVVWIHKDLADPTVAFRTPQSLFQFEVVTLSGVVIASMATTASLIWYIVGSGLAVTLWPAALLGVSLLIVVSAYAIRTVVKSRSWFDGN